MIDPVSIVALASLAFAAATDVPDEEQKPSYPRPVFTSKMFFYLYEPVSYDQHGNTHPKGLFIVAMNRPQLTLFARAGNSICRTMQVIESASLNFDDEVSFFLDRDRLSESGQVLLDAVRDRIKALDKIHEFRNVVNESNLMLRMMLVDGQTPDSYIAYHGEFKDMLGELPINPRELIAHRHEFQAAMITRGEYIDVVLEQRHGKKGPRGKQEIELLKHYTKYSWEKKSKCLWHYSFSWSLNTFMGAVRVMTHGSLGKHDIEPAIEFFDGKQPEIYERS